MSEFTCQNAGRLSSAWRATIAAARSGLRRLHRAERGATLTEFIITLPVFLLIFSAILKMTLLQTTTVQLKAKAAQDLWNQTMRVQRQPTPSHHLNPRDASQHSRMKMSNSDVDRDFSDDLDEEKFAGLEPSGPMTGGTIGESGAALREVSGALNNTADFQLPGSVNQPTDNTATVIRRQGRNYATGQSASEMYTAQLVGEQRTAHEPDTLDPPLNAMKMGSPQNRETNAAFAAGARYGLVEVNDDASGLLDDIPYVEGQNITVGYDTLVAPQPLEPNFTRDHYRTVGMARRFMGEYNFDNYSGIQFP
jgi:hypothetical protein